MTRYTAVGLVAFLSSGIAVASDDDPVPTTPPGVMLVEILRELGFSSDQYLGTRLGDAEGRTLLYHEGDCDRECRSAFTPFAAAENAQPVDDWTIVDGPGGGRQWAYQSRALYTWSGETQPDGLAARIVLAESVDPDGGEASGLDDRDDLPPSGWRLATFTPARTIERPAGIGADLVTAAQSVVLTTHDGFTLYTGMPDGYGDCADCARTWLPLAAPALASGIGEFSVLSRNDGTRQWAWRGRPLYRYRDDTLPGDAHGRRADHRWRLATLKTDFRPDGVMVHAQPGYGDVLSSEGRTLYTGSAFEKYWGGRNLRGSFRVAYFKGKRLGGHACADDRCLEEWRPFRASPGDVSSGFWEVITRPDGTGQWAYKGFALYTYAGDESPGQMNGHSLYSFAKLDGSAEDMARTGMLARVGNAPGGAGVYWSIAKP